MILAAYGSIRVDLSLTLNDRYQNMPVSMRNARLNMGRELIDFMENDIPELLTGIIQAVMAVIILGYFHVYLALSAVAASVGMVIMYSLFHTLFYNLNSGLNGQMGKTGRCSPLGLSSQCFQTFSQFERLGDQTF